MARLNTKISGGEWAAGIGACAAALALSKGVGLSSKWEHAVVDTVILLSAVLIQMRPLWHRLILWPVIVLIFSIHVSIVFLVTRSLPTDSPGISMMLGFQGVATLVLEGILIALLLWKVVECGGAQSKDRR